MVAALHLIYAPAQDARSFPGIRYHGRHQMGQSGVKRHVHHFRIYQDELQFIRAKLHEHGRYDAVHAHGLAVSDGSGYQQVRHDGQIADDRMPVVIYPQSQGELLICRQKVRRFQYVLNRGCFMAVPVYTRASQKRTGPVDGQLAGLVCSHRREMIQELKGRAMVVAPLGIPGAGILGHIVNGFIGSAAVLAGIAGFFRTFVKGMESFICSFRMAGAFVAGQFPDAGIAASAVFAIIVTHSCNQYVFYVCTSF